MLLAVIHFCCADCTDAVGGTKEAFFDREVSVENSNAFDEWLVTAPGNALQVLVPFPPHTHSSVSRQLYRRIGAWRCV